MGTIVPRPDRALIGMAALLLCLLPRAAWAEPLEPHAPPPWLQPHAARLPAECRVRILVRLEGLAGDRALAREPRHATARERTLRLRLAPPDAAWSGDLPESSGASADAHRDRIAQSEELRWALAGTLLLTALDEETIEWFEPGLDDRPADSPVRSVGALGSGVPMAAIIVAPALLDGRYGRKTSELSAMASLNALLWTEGVKLMIGKERPYQSGGRVRFHGPGSGFDAFPSGHAAASFAAAEVLAHRYPRLQLVFYFLAAGVSLARIDAGRHFPSDAFAGAAIGVYSGRLVVRHGGKLHVPGRNLSGTFRVR